MTTSCAVASHPAAPWPVTSWPVPYVFLATVGACLLLGACAPSSESDTAGAPPPSRLDSLSVASAAPPESGAAPKLARSQTLYVPAYSNIYYRNAEQSMNLTTTLSIRNASPESPLVLSVIDYYDSSGKRVRSYLDTTRVLDPLASTSVVVDVGDIRGGVGANFIVRWHAKQPVPPPVVETVMITTESTQGISFRSPARVLREERATPDTLDQESAR